MVELEDVYFLFDYFKGVIPQLNKDKDIVVFSSHKHHDHFNPEIFELMKDYPKAQFVLSTDIPIRWAFAQYKDEGIDLQGHTLRIKKNVEAEMSLRNGNILNIRTLIPLFFI